MQANFAKRGGVVVVELTGRLSFENSEPFRRTCLERLVREKVVFDLSHLNFVGSLGLKDFVETLDVMARQSGAGVKFCGVSSEFRRLFEATSLRGLEIFDSTEKAIQSFARPTP
ncbi:MAG: anti-sigma factor antagonist [Bdellovibrionales bacterium]|nr:anti-sigma factor antagonist [Bdellovibrionales bacterium]